MEWMPLLSARSVRRTAKQPSHSDASALGRSAMGGEMLAQSTAVLAERSKQRMQTIRLDTSKQGSSQASRRWHATPCNAAAPCRCCLQQLLQPTSALMPAPRLHSLGPFYFQHAEWEKCRVGELHMLAPRCLQVLVSCLDCVQIQVVQRMNPADEDQIRLQLQA